MSPVTHRVCGADSVLALAALLSVVHAGSYFGSGTVGAATDLEWFGAGVIAAVPAERKLVYGTSSSAPTTIVTFSADSGAPWGVAVATSLGGVFVSLNSGGPGANISSIAFVPLAASAPTSAGTPVVVYDAGDTSDLRDVDFSSQTSRLYWAGVRVPSCFRALSFSAQC
jgi:hypothetical protein